MEVRDQPHAPAASSRINPSLPLGTLSVGRSVGPRISMDSLVGGGRREKKNLLLLRVVQLRRVVSDIHY